MLRLRRPRAPLHTLRRVLAVALAGAALLLAVRPDPVPQGARGPAGLPVVVASGDLPAGTVLDEADLDVAALPRAVVPDGAVGTVGVLVGQVLATAVRTGEPLTDVRLVGAGLTALLPEGQVAAPVRPADLGVSALVDAGDRIDVLVTAPGAGSAELVAARALVLAAPGSGVDGDGLLLVAVDGPTASRLAAAATSGTLTVTLVPP